MLDKEYEYFQKNKVELLEQYRDKFIVIKGDQVIGSYETEKDAYDQTMKDHEAGSFLIQQCVENEEKLTQTFHSRTIF